MTAKLSYTVRGGYECDIASLKDGWALAAVCIDDVDQRFVRNMDLDKEWEYGKALLFEGVTRDQWNDAYVSQRARLELVESRSGVTTTAHEMSAEQFSGVSVNGGCEADYLWTALDGGLWNVALHSKGKTDWIYASNNVLLGPAVTRVTDGTLWCAWVSRDGEEDIIWVTDQSRSRTYKVPGRYPDLVPTAQGVAICYERFAEGQSQVYCSVISNNSISEPIQVSFRQPLNFLPRGLWTGDEHLLVVWESSPEWGFDIRADQIRHIELRTVDLDTADVSDGPGTKNGCLPIPLRSFGRSPSPGMSINMTPSNPRLIEMNGKLTCTFRMFEPDLKQQSAYIVDGGINKELDLLTRREGWHLCETTLVETSWQPPRRLSNSVGFSHHPYGAIGTDSGLLVAGHALTTHQAPPRDSRIEVLEAGEDLPAMHLGIPTFHPQAVHTANPITQAPKLTGAPQGLQLVFGDLHDHTSHSPCAPAIDGSPLDNIRLQRDAFANEVICIADHQNISDQDYRLRMDLLERDQTAGRLPIYALEWSKPPWQHTNFYTYDKTVMKHLRQILLGQHDLHLVFSEIADRFLGKVTAMRHYHDYARIGGHGEVGDTHVFFYDPRIEWGMEVLRGRGDAMATVEGMFSGLSDFPFPVNFIEWRNAKLGLIGASDHHQSSLGACMTGFWTKSVTGEAVFDAIRRRCTIACANGKASMWVKCGEVGMGDIGTASPPFEIDVSVAAALPMDRLSLWADGNWVQHQSFEEGQTDATFVVENPEPGEHYYIVRAQSVHSKDFPKGPIICYSSPIWLTLG